MGDADAAAATRAAPTTHPDGNGRHRADAARHAPPPQRKATPTHPDPCSNPTDPPGRASRAASGTGKADRSRGGTGRASGARRRCSTRSQPAPRRQVRQCATADLARTDEHAFELNTINAGGGRRGVETAGNDETREAHPTTRLGGACAGRSTIP